MKKIISVAILLLTLNSCSFFTAATDVVDDYVSIEWKGNNDGKAIDSIRIIYHPAYVMVPKSELDSSGIILNQDINGYEVWVLEDVNFYHFDVRKKDTVIYIYEK
jgi:hypothetical protein